MSEVNTRVRDMFGNLIQSGDYITYPCRQGSSTYMRTAKVRGIDERSRPMEPSQLVLKATTCIPPRWPERKHNPDWEDNVILKKTTISEFQRAVVVPKAYIQNDPRYKKLLEV